MHELSKSIGYFTSLVVSPLFTYKSNMHYKVSQQELASVVSDSNYQLAVGGKAKRLPNM